jgi:hypothetical protein
MEHQRDDRSLGELFQELSRETSLLIRQEVALAKTEMTEKAQQLGKDAGFLGAGGAIAYAGFIVILGGLAILVLSEVFSEGLRLRGDLEGTI